MNATCSCEPHSHMARIVRALQLSWRKWSPWGIAVFVGSSDGGGLDTSEHILGHVGSTFKDSKLPQYAVGFTWDPLFSIPSPWS